MKPEKGKGRFTFTQKEDNNHSPLKKTGRISPTILGRPEKGFVFIGRKVEPPFSLRGKKKCGRKRGNSDLNWACDLSINING